MDGGADAPLSMFDAGRDAAPDVPDAFMCVPGTVTLSPSEVDVVFAIDRSGSMDFDFAGELPVGGADSRWEVLESTLPSALSRFDRRIGVGAVFFPHQSRRTLDACAVANALTIDVGPGHGPGIVSHFRTWNPFGGTPIGPAIELAMDSLEERAGPNLAQFVVLATDGQPSCGADPFEHAFESIRSGRENLGIDTFVIGIATTPVEVEVLNRLAELGGRPRDEEPRFYDARSPELLGELLDEIATDLTACVFAVPIPPGPEDEIDVVVGGVNISQDRLDGWDWTGESRSQLSLFGASCQSAVAGGVVRATIRCN